jgi:hypothetical protein
MWRATLERGTALLPGRMLFRVKAGRPQPEASCRPGRDLGLSRRVPVGHIETVVTGAGGFERAEHGGGRVVAVNEVEKLIPVAGKDRFTRFHLVDEKCRSGP